MKNQKPKNPFLLLCGTISKLERSQRTHSFILSDLQQRQVGATAIAGSVMGMGAASVGLVGMAGNSDEEAEWVEFELDVKEIKGWLWMMPMRNGDNVEIVAEPMGNNRYTAYAVKRKSDDLLAVYPHATAGRKVHYRKSTKAWAWCSSLLFLFVTMALAIDMGWEILLKKDIRYFFLISFLLWLSISAIIAFRVSRKLMAFVEIAELTFETFGWPDVENIDLRKTSVENRRENKLPNYGSLYFRYK